jgi:signal transduction histidine kinase
LYFKILIVVAILSLAVILLIYQNWKRSKSNIAGLRSLNQQVMEQKVKLEETLAELEHQSREKDRILRVVAHDLRNPIGGVASVSGLLLSEPLSDDQKEMMELIQNACQDALLLINEILEISAINSPSSLPVEPTDVNTLTFNTIELLRFKATEKGQQLTLEAFPQPAIAMANREKLARVISNLISNAIKFNRSGGKTVVKVEKAGEHILISVADNGIGIPDSIKGKVFDIFTDAKRSGTAGEKPFGLGLSISRQIVEALAGRIWFENNPGGGTIFYIELPACEQPVIAAAMTTVSGRRED